MIFDDPDDPPGIASISFVDVDENEGILITKWNNCYNML